MYKFLLRQRMKKGFTIVELVIVIAVIAILSAILIPTFVNVTRAANVAADQAAAKNMNEILAIANAQGIKVDNMTDVIKVVNDGGYVIENLNPTAQGYHYVWDSESNQILYLNEKYEIAYSSKNTTTTTPNANWWTTVKTSGEFKTITDKGISVYVAKEITENLIVTKLVSIDTGYTEITGALTMTSDETGDVILRGKFNEVTINCPMANISQYGSVTTLTVTAVKDASYHVFGVVGTASIASGRMEIEPSGTIITLAKATSPSTVNIVNNGSIVTVDSGVTINTNNGIIKSNVGTVTKNDGWVKDSSGGTISGGTNPAATTEKPQNFSDVNINVGTAAELENIATAVNNGANYADCVITLTADIDLTNRTWTPIGEKQDKPFIGTFDGNNHKIIGLSNTGYVGGASFYIDDIQKDGTGAFALFNFITGNTTIKNLSVSCNISGDGSGVAGIVAVINNVITGGVAGDILIKNCKVSGSITGKDKVGGIVGSTYISTSEGQNVTVNVRIEDCENSANVIGANRVGGIAGTNGRESGKINGVDAKGVATREFVNCSNIGTIKSTGTTDNACAGGIIGFESAIPGTGCTIFSNCSSTSTVSGGNPNKILKIDLINSSLIGILHDGRLIKIANQTYKKSSEGNNLVLEQPK